jgi:hypothetical protein
VYQNESLVAIPDLSGFALFYMRSVKRLKSNYLQIGDAADQNNQVFTHWVALSLRHTGWNAPRLA